MKNLTLQQACERIITLEERHGQRRGWVWARLGQAPLAIALGYLARAVSGMQAPVGGSELEKIITNYTNLGWRVDASIVEALAAVEAGNDQEAVRTAVRAVYCTWLEDLAFAFQKALAAHKQAEFQAETMKTPEAGTCVLFFDGLRYDLAQVLKSVLEAHGCAAEIGARFTPLPPITATAKPAILNDKAKLTGKNSASFDPGLPGNKSTLNAEALRKLLMEKGYQILKEDELGDPAGRAWTEIGEIDAYGHEHSSKLAVHIQVELMAIEKRVRALLEHGWRQVIIVTDHGWLLLPGGLPKVQLPEHLTFVRKGRCARLKEGAQVDMPTFPWYWDPDIWIAFAPGISCFEAGKEYEHGGLSPQECITPSLQVRKAQDQSLVQVSINGLTWKGLRCTVDVTGGNPTLEVDIRSKAGDPATSLIKSAKSPDEHGHVSLLVEDEDRLGEAAFLVVMNRNGQLLTQQLVTVGG